MTNLSGIRVFYVTQPVKAAMIVKTLTVANSAAIRVYDTGTPKLSAIPVYEDSTALAAIRVKKVN